MVLLSVASGCGLFSAGYYATDGYVLMDGEALSGDSPSGDEYRPFWRPLEADIARIRRQLAIALSQATDEMGKHTDLALDSYRIQYVGVTHEGEHALWINAFCRSREDAHPYWKARLVQVKGGGSCYFNALCSEKADQCAWLFFNALR